jgi:hypothetical protein
MRVTFPSAVPAAQHLYRHRSPGPRGHGSGGPCGASSSNPRGGRPTDPRQPSRRLLPGTHTHTPPNSNQPSNGLIITQSATTARRLGGLLDAAPDPHLDPKDSSP